MISLSGVGMAFGTQVLFENVTWRLHPGAHYGLVGANGTGKSTLLRLMAGELPPEAGAISRPNSLALGTLGQDHFGHDPDTLLQVVIGGRPRLRKALDDKAALLESIGQGIPNETDGHRLAELEAVIADEEGYAAEAQAATLLTGLGLESGRHARPMGELSGGYRLRVLLARTLFAAPQLLLLDEPTNHLDIDAIRWLEGHLREFPGAFVIVSHDRHFLNAVCGHIADLDYQELRLYPGDYDAFLAAKELAVAQKESEITRAEEKIAEMERFVERFRAKATKARQAQSRKKQLERMELPEIKRTLRRHPGFRFEQRRPSGREVLRVSGLCKGFGGHAVLDGVAFTLRRGEKLAVVGPNGIGKSTLLKILCGELPPDAGVVEPGHELRLGYMAQDHREVLRGRTSVHDWLYAVAPAETVGTIRGTLGRVLFSGDEVEKAVGDLSGGEGARLLLAALMIRRDNLLVLDEPTNHLDLEGREALMNALRDFEGTVIFVSHDRHFVSHVGTRVLALGHGGVEDAPGNYEDYLAARGEDFLASGVAAASPKQEDRPPGSAAGTGAGGEAHAARKAQKKALGRLRKQVERLESEVAGVEAELEALAGRFGREGYYEDTPWEEVRQDQHRQQEAQQRLEDAVRRWEEAAAQLERLQDAS